MLDLETYGMKALQFHAYHLNSIHVPDSEAKIEYDILADALVWSDETVVSTPTDVIQGLRQLRQHACNAEQYRTYQRCVAALPITVPEMDWLSA